MVVSKLVHFEHERKAIVRQEGQLKWIQAAINQQLHATASDPLATNPDPGATTTGTTSSGSSTRSPTAQPTTEDKASKDHNTVTKAWTTPTWASCPLGWT